MTPNAAAMTDPVVRAAVAELDGSAWTSIDGVGRSESAIAVLCDRVAELADVGVVGTATLLALFAERRMQDLSITELALAGALKEWLRRQESIEPDYLGRWQLTAGRWRTHGLLAGYPKPGPKTLVRIQRVTCGEQGGQVRLLREDERLVWEENVFGHQHNLFHETLDEKSGRVVAFKLGRQPLFVQFTGGPAVIEVVAESQNKGRRQWTCSLCKRQGRAKQIDRIIRDRFVSTLFDGVSWIHSAKRAILSLFDGEVLLPRVSVLADESAREVMDRMRQDRVDRWSVDGPSSRFKYFVPLPTLRIDGALVQHVEGQPIRITPLDHRSLEVKYFVRPSEALPLARR